MATSDSNSPTARRSGTDGPSGAGGFDEVAQLLAPAAEDDGHRPEEPKARGYAVRLADGYGPDDVNRVFGRLQDAVGVRLICLWDYHDGSSFGGSSRVYAETEDGRLHEPDGLWEWLNSSRAAASAPVPPGLPPGWLGEQAAVPLNHAHDDGLHNYADEDTAPLADRRSTTRFYLRRHRLDMLRDRPWVVMDEVTGKVAQLDDGLRLAYLATRQEAVAFRDRRNEQHRSHQGPLYIDWDSEDYGAAQAMHLYIIGAEEADAAVARVLEEAGFPGRRSV
ncbi:hypothetical protein ABZ896_12250 [Streptomyces sp. NPDC047072]|uniref:hypothetical protein n=1 Tax=Streptomyces sp. NPDC047072 TaxID=3154809 RepID=UPI00340DFE99